MSVIGAAIEREVQRCGFFVIRELTGHGVGRKIHEAPTVANFAAPWATDVLHDGLVIAVEPIVTASPTHARDLADGWTIAAADGGIAVHHEHTIVIRDGAPLILTAPRRRTSSRATSGRSSGARRCGPGATSGAAHASSCARCWQGSPPRISVRLCCARAVQPAV